MQPDNHTSKQFDADLAHIRSRVLLMGGLAEQQLGHALEALRSGDSTFADLIVATEIEINGLEVSIDELCTSLIARRQPNSVDLRLILSVYKTITDLERIGDEAKKIGLLTRQFRGDRWNFPCVLQVRRMGGMVIDMLRRSIDAFSRMDSTDVPAVVLRDTQVDEEFSALIRMSLSFMLEDPRTISAGLDLVFVAKALERTGDHVKNIAENTVYAISGTNVRHAGFAELQRAALE